MLVPQAVQGMRYEHLPRVTVSTAHPKYHLDLPQSKRIILVGYPEAGTSPVDVWKKIREIFLKLGDFLILQHFGDPMECPMSL